MVRDYTKWDDAPVSLAHFAESAVRAYKIAMTPPMEPVVIVADGVLQEEPITEKNLRVPKLFDELTARRAIQAPSRKPRKCWWPPRIRSSWRAAWRARRMASSCWWNWPKLLQAPRARSAFCA